MLLGAGPTSGLPLASIPPDDDVSVLTGPVVLNRAPRPREYLLVAEPFDPASGALTSVYLSAAGYTCPGDGAGAAEGIPDWTHFTKAITGPGNTSIDFVSSGRWRPAAQSTVGVLTLLNRDRVLDELLRLRWERRRGRLYVGQLAWWRSFGEFQQFLDVVFDGRPEEVGRTVRLRYFDRRRELDVELNEASYLGFGNCLRYDGVDDYAEVGNHFDFGATDSFTVEVRFRDTALGTDRWMMQKGAAESAAPLWRANFNAADQLVVRIDDGVTGIGPGFAAPGLRDGRWHTLSFRVDRPADLLTILVDGEFRVANGLAGVGSLVTSSPLWFGKSNIGRFWSGDLDEVRVWRTARTDAEIKAWWNRPVDPAAEPTLVGHWSKDEGGGATVFNGCALTRRAILLDGVDDVEEVTLPAQLSGGAFTVEVMMKDAVGAANQCMWSEGHSANATRCYSLRSAATPSSLRALIINDAGGAVLSKEWTAVFVGAGPRHLTYVDDGAGTVRLYVNGAAHAGGAGAYTPTALTFNRVAFGAILRVVAAGFWPGTIYYARLWRRAIAAADVPDLVNNPSPRNTAGLEVFLRHDEGTGQPLDTGPNLRTVTLTGGTWTSTHAAVTGATWIGTGEGGADLVGKRRARVWGQRRQLEGDLVDRQRGVYEVAHDPRGYGAAGAEVEVVPYVDGNAGALTSDGVVADVYAGAAPAVDRYTVQAAGDRILVRVGGDAPERKRVTFDVRVGPANAAAIIEEVALEAEVDPAEIDAFALGVVATERPGTIGYSSRRERVTASQVLSSVAETVDAYWYHALRDGLFTAALRRLPADPETRIDATMVRGEPRRRNNTAPPAKQVRVLWGHHDVVFDEPDIATAVAGAARAALRQPFRAWETPLDEEVEEESLDAEVFEVSTLYDLEADARAHAERLAEIDGLRPDVWDVDLVEGIFEYRLGQVVEIDVPVEGLEGGAVMVVAGLVESQEIDQLTLILARWL